MFIGLMATIFLIPLIRGSDGEPLALETLAVGHDRPQNKLNKIRKWKVKKAVRGNDVRDEENREYAGDPTAAEEQGMIPDRQMTVVMYTKWSRWLSGMMSMMLSTKLLNGESLSL
jgi:hypothetical protein